MKKIYLFTLIIFSLFKSYGQPIKDFKSYKASNLLADADKEGNTIIFFKSDSTFGNYDSYYQFFVINNNKIINSVTTLLKHDFIGSRVNDSLVYYYYIDVNKKEESLSALIFNKYKKGYKQVNNIYKLNGDLISFVSDEKCYFLTYDEKADQILVTSIQGINMVAKQHFTVKMPFFKDHLTKTKFIYHIRNNIPINTYEAHFKNKIYKNGNKLILTFDEFQSYHGVYKNGNITEIIELDLDTETSDYYSFKENNEKLDSYNSFYLDNTLYRLSVYSKNIEVSAYDCGKKILINKYLLSSKDASNKIASSPYYVRVAENNILDYSIIKDMNKLISIFNRAKPSISAFKLENNSVQLTVGSYFDEKGHGTLFAPDPLTALVTFALTTAINQMMEGPGISHYFYANFDKEHFQIQTSPIKSFSQKNDDAEIDFIKNKKKIKLRKYFSNAGKPHFVYHDLKEKKIVIVGADQ